MSRTTYRALLVDDEAALRRLLIRAMSREGFTCDPAEDGGQALAMLGSGKYDLVVTDLAMPNGNGHALALDVLSRSERPLLVVLTGLFEPKLAKDLLALGLDDIVFKPVHPDLFAAKMKSLVDRRLASAGATPRATQAL